MSILKVANIHFEAAGTKRIDYLNDDVLRISFGETVLSGNARFNGNGATKLSVGTTAQRPTGESGLIRFNTQVGSFEGHNGSAWGSIGGAVDLTPANNYSREVGAAGNGWANTVASDSANAANALSLNRSSAANLWTNTVFGYSNTKFLANSSDVVFNGTLNFLGGNVHINRTTSTVGNDVRLDVNGAINASAVLINGVATGGGTTIFTANLGNNSVNTFNIAHNLNKLFVIPAVREYSSGYYVYPDVKTTTPNHIVIEFVNAPTTNQYAVLIVG